MLCRVMQPWRCYYAEDDDVVVYECTRKRLIASPQFQPIYTLCSRSQVRNVYMDIYPNADADADTDLVSDVHHLFLASQMSK
jgi:hypothetical protein